MIRTRSHTWLARLQCVYQGEPGIIGVEQIQPDVSLLLPEVTELESPIVARHHSPPSPWLHILRQVMVLLWLSPMISIKC